MMLKDLNEIVRIFTKDKSFRYIKKERVFFFLSLQMYELGIQKPIKASNNQLLQIIWNKAKSKKTERMEIDKICLEDIYNDEDIVNKDLYYTNFMCLLDNYYYYDIKGITSIKLYSRKPIDYVLIAFSKKDVIMYNDNIDLSDSDFKIIEKIDENWYRVSINYKEYFTHKKTFTSQFEL